MTAGTLIKDRRGEAGSPVPKPEVSMTYNAMTPCLLERDFLRLSRFIYDRFGISIPPAKKFMLESRLLKRLRKLNMTSFAEYCGYLFSDEGMKNEVVQMIDLVTTNKTSFFRESAHFDFMLAKALPDMAENTGAGIRRPLSVWSAGCSSGEEPYTLAMVLTEYKTRCSGFQFRITGTDISTRMLEKAKIGIYHEEAAAAIPMDYRKKYLLRSKDRDEELVRIVPALREMVTFRRLNLMDDDFGFHEPVDMIFCRNVIIYFDRATQERLMHKMYGLLGREGILFMGHSETLNDLGLPLKPVFPSVYRKKP